MCHGQPEQYADESLAWRFAGRRQRSIMMLLTGAADESRRLEPGSYEEYINEKYAQEKSSRHVLAIAELADRCRGDEVDILYIIAWVPARWPSIEHRCLWRIVKLEVKSKGAPIRHTVKVRRMENRSCPQQGLVASADRLSFSMRG